MEVDIPDGWSKLEIPSKLPATVRSVVKVLSPGQDAEVAISEMDIVMSMDEAEVSYIRGASRGGFQHFSTTDVTKLGLAGKHIIGEFRSPDGTEVISAESYILQASDSMISVGVTGADAKGLLPKVLAWLTIDRGSSGAAIGIAENASETRRDRSLFEYAGMGLVLAAFGYAIFRKKFKSKSKDSNNNVQ